MQNADRTLQEVEYPAKLTGLAPTRIYDLCRRGIFPHVRIGRQIRFDPIQIDQWIDQGGQSLPGGWRQNGAAE